MANAAGEGFYGERYEVRFRHSGMEPAVGDEWIEADEEPRLCSIEDIKSEAQNHNITHLEIFNKIPTNLSSLFPHIRHFAINSSRSDVDIDKNVLQSISRLTELEVLTLESNSLAGEIEDLDIFSALSSLRLLNLNWCELRRLPPSISLLSSLEELHLQGNTFATTEGIDVFATLTSLKELNLSCCELSELPSSMSALTALEVLNLRASRFRSSSKISVLGSLRSLKELHLPRCLKELPPCISQLTALEFLNLEDNDFTSVDELNHLSSLKLLKDLNLSSCGLSNLPQGIAGLVELRTLDLRCNRFIELPQPVCTLKKLQELKLTRNAHLKALNAAIVDMVDLQTVAVKGCRSLTYPPYNVCQQGIQAIREYYRGSTVRIKPISSPSTASTSKAMPASSQAGVRRILPKPPSTQPNPNPVALLPTIKRPMAEDFSNSSEIVDLSMKRAKPALPTTSQESPASTSRHYDVTNGSIVPVPPNFGISSAATTTRTVSSTAPPNHTSGFVPIQYATSTHSNNMLLVSANIQSSPAVMASRQGNSARPHEESARVVPTTPPLSDVLRLTDDFMDSANAPPVSSAAMPTGPFLADLNDLRRTGPGPPFNPMHQPYLRNAAPMYLPPATVQFPPTLRAAPQPVQYTMYQPRQLLPMQPVPPVHNGAANYINPQIQPQPPVMARAPLVQAPAPPPAPPVPLAPPAPPAPLAPTNLIPYHCRGVISGQTIKLTVDNEGRSLIFPFSVKETVGWLTNHIVKETNKQVSILDQPDESIYTDMVKLSSVDRPFLIVIGDCYNEVEDGKRKGRGQADSSDEEEAPGTSFGIVSTARHAIDLLTLIHDQVKSGRSSSTHQALKKVKKDRKTVDRFRNIYYLHVIDKDKLTQLEREWEENEQQGGLQMLDEKASRHITSEMLQSFSRQGKLTIFGRKKK